MSEECRILDNAGHLGPYIRHSADTYTHFEMESLACGGWGYTHFPLTARHVRTLGKPYLGMIGRFHTSWGDFHSYKSQAALEFECFNTPAMGARCLFPKGRSLNCPPGKNHIHCAVPRIEGHQMVALEFGQPCLKNLDVRDDRGDRWALRTIPPLLSRS